MTLYGQEVSAKEAALGSLGGDGVETKQHLPRIFLCGKQGTFGA